MTKNEPILQELILKLRLRKHGSDDYRPKQNYINPMCDCESSKDNPSFSVSSKGWHCHKCGKGGSLKALYAKVFKDRNNGNVDHAKNIGKAIIQNSKSDPALVRKYLSTRKLDITDEQIESLRLNINEYRNVTSLVYALQNVSGDIIQLGAIPFDKETGAGSGVKKFHNVIDDGQDRAYTINPKAKEAVIFEGLVDGLTYHLKINPDA
ncbi:hypothetical protein MCHI_000134, partial [Candidatus Magnetoovum chiemensis]